MKSGQIRLVISSKDGVFALERARAAGIPTAVCSRSGSASPADFEGAIQALLEQEGIELIILAGFMSILSEDFVAKWPKRIINVHPSLIPSFCGQGFYGLRVHQAALERGVKLTGATVHFVNQIPDGGEIILQKSVPVCLGDTAEALQRRVMEQAEWRLLPKAAELISAKIQKEGHSYGK